MTFNWTLVIDVVSADEQLSFADLSFEDRP